MDKVNDFRAIVINDMLIDPMYFSVSMKSIDDLLDVLHASTPLLCCCGIDTIFSKHAVKTNDEIFGDGVLIRKGTKLIERCYHRFGHMTIIDKSIIIMHILNQSYLKLDMYNGIATICLLNRMIGAAETVKSSFIEIVGIALGAFMSHNLQFIPTDTTPPYDYKNHIQFLTNYDHLTPFFYKNKVECGWYGDCNVEDI